jgi:hypothetical protein
MRCLFRLGCLFILLVGGVIAWLTRDVWMSRLPWAKAPATAPRGATWQPLTDSGAARTRAALRQLSQPAGQVFATLSGADLASFIFDSVAKRSPGAVDSAEAIVVGDQIRVRARVKTSELGGGAAIGAMTSLLNERERVELAGTLRMPEPGVGEFTVTEVSVRDFPLPKSVVGRVLQRGGGGGAETSGATVRFTLPDYIGDVRVANGRITLYKTAR